MTHILTLQGIPPTLLNYAAQHRDERNIMLHIISIPAIIFSGMLWLNLLASIWFSFSWFSFVGGCVFVMLALFYTYLSGTLGLIASTWIILLCLLSQILNQWLGGIFATILLFFAYISHRLGHWYEGNYRTLPIRAANLLAAPLFVTSQLFAHLGLFKQVYDTINAQVGPTYLRDMANAHTDL